MKSFRLSIETARIWFFTAVICSLLVTALFIIFRADFTRFSSAEADTFSTSYLGHKAFAELLAKYGIPVVISTASSGKKCGSSSLLLVAEPRFSSDDNLQTRRFQWMIENTATRMIIFPKWDGHIDRQHPGRLISVAPVNDQFIKNLWSSLKCDGAVFRSTQSTTTAWQGLPETMNIHIESPQLIKSDDVEPIISCKNGILFGKISGQAGDGATYLLSDPDLIANFNLGNGDNALFILTILNRIRKTGGIVIDETLHGYELRRSVLRNFFEFPLMTVLISIILCTLLLLWFASVRFGTPIQAPMQYNKGKSQLIANTAAVLLRGSHYDFILERFFHHTVAAVIHSVPGASAVPSEQIVEYLDTIAKQRGVESRLISLQIRMNELKNKKHPVVDEMLAIAKLLHVWKKEMLYGF